ncbi:MAG: dihydroxy-acid dehydratase [Muribaculaceae bacterium]
MTEEKLTFYKHNACPSCGACSFMGTASTMQVMAEALGLMLPGSALMPATSPDLLEFAKKAGEQAVWLAKNDLKPSDIVTMKSFENAIMVQLFRFYKFAFTFAVAKNLVLIRCRHI